MNTTKVVLSFVLCLFFLGCSSSAKMENMIYLGEAKTYDESLYNAVEVESVLGGQETNPMWTSQIGNNAFAGAVKQSLADQGLLAEDGKYTLEVILHMVDQPLFGLNMTVTTMVQYVLTDTTDGSVVMDDKIVAEHTATVGDAFVGATRLRLANEGSGRRNIEGLLDKLSALKIKPQEISLLP